MAESFEHQFDKNITFNEDCIIKALIKSLNFAEEFGIYGESKNYKVHCRNDVIKSTLTSLEEKVVSLSSNEIKLSEKDSLCSESKDSIQNNFNSKMLKQLHKFVSGAEVHYAIDLMYNLHKGKEKALEENNEFYRKTLAEDDAQILTFEALSQKLEKIQSTEYHLTKINEDYHKLKELLRTSNDQDVWKIHIDCQKFVVQFFELADMVIKKFENSIECAKWSCCVDLDSSTMESLLHIFKDQVAKLHLHVDALSEYRTLLKDSFNIV